MPVLTRAHNKTNEAEVARIMSQKWRCEVSSTGYLDSWDFVGVKDGRTCFIAELKSREILPTTHPDIWLSAHKWYTMTHAAQSMGIVALFVVRFADGSILYQPLSEIDARSNGIRERKGRSGIPNDRELVIFVPVDSMKVLHAGEASNG